MKRFLILTICFGSIIILAGGCSKNTEPASINGTWELRETSAAMNPNLNYYPPGNGNILKFSNGNYEIYANGQLTKSGNFTVIKDGGVEDNVCLVFPAGQYSDRIIYDNTNTSKIFFQISNNKLSFISGCYAIDAGHAETYERTN